MKKYILIVFVLLLFIFLYLLKIKYNQENKINNIPEFCFLSEKNTPFTSDSLLNTNAIIIFFHSECETCQYELEDISLWCNNTPNTKILLVSEEPISTLNRLSKKYSFENCRNIYMLNRNNDNSFGELHTVPFIFIYDKHKKLIKQYSGGVKIKPLLEYIDNAYK
jgi:thiol-disulfide isomerase/thioredoxin